MHLMKSETFNINLVNVGKSITAAAGDTLFKALHDANIFIPTVCGGKGFCGKCKVKVFSGNKSSLTDSEKKKLSSDEVAEGWRMSCQAVVESDMDIELPDDTKNVRLYTAEVIALGMVCRETRRVRLRLLAPDEMEYLPGAFILLDIPPAAGSRLALSRAYSIATPPSSVNEIELNVKHVPEGKGSGFVHDVLKPGDKVTFSAPYSGYPRSSDENELICVAGGSGISPVLSILRHLKETESRRKIKFFFGVRTCDDLQYISELRTLEKSMHAFEFFSVVEFPGENTSKDTIAGRVTDAVIRSVEDASGCSAYLCGSQGLLEACRTILLERGISENDIFYDQFF